MRPTTTATMARTRQILEDLEDIRQNLVELSDDIWLSIDHNDSETMEAGVEFKREFNSKSAAFDDLANELSALVQQYTSVRLEEAEQSGGDDATHNERIIADLNRDEPHHLVENFTFKRPHGFILDGYAMKGLRTWTRLYEIVWQREAT